MSKALDKCEEEQSIQLSSCKAGRVVVVVPLVLEKAVRLSIHLLVFHALASGDA